MPRKKRVTRKKKLAPIQVAENLVKEKPREFLIGFMSLLGLLVFVGYLAVYYYAQSRSIYGPNGVKITETQPTLSSQKFYDLKEGESLWDVAQNEYGNPLLYPTLVQLNDLQSPDEIEPGMRLRVK